MVWKQQEARLGLVDTQIAGAICQHPTRYCQVLVYLD